ncbi:acyl-CoA dehydrogenase [Albimonas donghaensis]|uniref:Acyl-[acyl-carrier-protein] dehydrogenase MbtN n=1 Tax=Albimonas donghaensis TaxID=356660 RepID=A0A1H2TVV6_9RHOB|nr:acyl-CoA dehydrogenase family protein [Albimonas donghaensis]SDW47848.1 acyl-CoA dehydrogenase [Albimonas donghaensis]
MLNTRSVLEPEHEDFRRAVAAFMEREVVPNYPEWEKNGVVDREVWPKAGEEGLLLMTAAEEYGGAGVDFRYAAVLNEEMSKRGISGPGFGLHSDIVAPYFTHYGTEEQKQRFLPRMARGEIIGSIAMTEPGAGSDVQNIKTTALKDGNEYVVSGAKTFITNGELADFVLVAAKTDPSLGAKGISLIVVETNREGFSRGKKLDKMGEKAQDIAELHFDNIRVPPENLIGEEGKGFKYLMEQLPQERLGLVLKCCASMEAALEWTLEHVKQRQAFGGVLLDLQNTRFKLAECKTETQIARLYADRLLEMHIKGELDVATVCGAKFWMSELEQKVIDTCLQFFGGYGYMMEYPIAKAYINARVHKIYAGSNEIMREVVARTL